MTGRACSVCIHKHRAAIDAELISGRAQKLVAETYKLSPDAVQRHRQRHLTAAGADGTNQSLAAETGEIDLLTDVFTLRKRLQRLLTRAERDKDIRGALLAIKECIRLVETVGKLTGQIDGSGVKVAVQINGTDSRGNAAIRERILAKLAAIAGDDQEPAPRGRTIDLVPEDDAAQ